MQGVSALARSPRANRFVQAVIPWVVAFVTPIAMAGTPRILVVL